MAYDYFNHPGREYVWETVPVDEQDRGANDEGYYHAWCPHCNRRTEQDDSVCTRCDRVTGN